MLQFIPVTIDSKGYSLPISGLCKYKSWMFDRMRDVCVDCVEVFMFGWIVRFYIMCSEWTHCIGSDYMFDAEFIEDDVRNCKLCDEYGPINEYRICNECAILGSKWQIDSYYIHAVSLTEIWLYMDTDHSVRCSLHLITDPLCTITYSDCIYVHWLITSIFGSTILLPEIINIISMYALSGLNCEWNNFGTSEGIDKTCNNSSDSSADTI